MLFEQLGINKREAKEMVGRFYEEISLALESGESVHFGGFGNFENGESTVEFHPSEQLKVMTHDGMSLRQPVLVCSESAPNAGTVCVESPLNVG
jgi:hypothetical protein